MGSVKEGPPAIVKHYNRYRFFVSCDTEEEAERRRAEIFGTPVQVGGCEVTGVTAAELPDFDTAFERAKAEYEKKALGAVRREAQTLKFDVPVVALFCFADQHFGSSGTDVQRAFDEAALVLDTPHSYACILGDVRDNYILSKLQHLNFNNMQPLKDQRVLTAEYIKRIADRLAVWGGGNHDNGWTQDLTGIDYDRGLVAKYAPGCLYDPDEVLFTVQVDGAEWTVKARHKWRGRSIYNDTHGIERAQKWEQNWTCGIGAHNHTGGLIREFVAGGRQGLAVMTGSYKRIDTYARELGLPPSGPSVGVAVVFDGETGYMRGFTDLERAAAWMRHLY
jgi:hypothetical protein